MSRACRSVALVWLLTFAGAAPAMAAEFPKAGDLVIEAHTLRTFDGRQHAAELGRLWVRESRAGDSGRLIEIAFLRLHSTAASPGPPIVFLMGGAGRGIVMGQIPPFFRLFDRLREVADVILLDQRGIGLSSPVLECPPDRSVAPDTFAEADKYFAEQAQGVRACAARFRAQGVDLAAFSHHARADDLEDLRRALGAEKVSLLAWSAGTETALAMLRYHGERVHRVVLSGTVGPDHILALPATADLELEKVSQLVAQSPTYQEAAFDLTTLVEKLLQRAARQPFTVTVEDRRRHQLVDITVGRFALQLIIQGELSDGRALPGLPGWLYALSQGDAEPLARKAEGMYNGASGASLAGLLLGCTQGWSPERLGRVEREAAGALLGTGASPLPELCGQLGVAGPPEARSPVCSLVPTLFLTGTLDASTPPFQAEEVRWGFPNSIHLIIENATHDLLPVDEVQTVVVDFLKGEDVSLRRIALPPPRFLSVEQAKSR